MSTTRKIATAVAVLTTLAVPTASFARHVEQNLVPIYTPDANSYIRHKGGHALPDCADPGSHLGCAPAPVHDNSPPPA